jgi:lysophospholipase L1-like esterase
MNKSIKNNDTKDTRVILLGDSMLEKLLKSDEDKTSIWVSNGFDKMNVFNAGIGGDRIENVLYRLVHMKFLDYFIIPPEKIIIMIGTNNIITDDTSDMIIGVKEIVNIIHSKFPTSTIILLAILPMIYESSNKYSNLYNKIITYNKLLSQIDNTQFVDFSDEFRHNNWIYYLDAVHLNLAGNKIFINHLLKLIK